ncbi:MAG TPA: DUF2007 domain-containing protein [Gaiellaceae bacterium]|nr:DUF2007 domain-containing protein [Gaiellaceae bacterium]
MDEVPLTIATNDVEAEVICGLLETAGIQAVQRQTDVATGAGLGFSYVGPREILVAESDLERAREVLEAAPEPPS